MMHSALIAAGLVALVILAIIGLAAVVAFFGPMPPLEVPVPKPYWRCNLCGVMVLDGYTEPVVCSYSMAVNDHLPCPMEYVGDPHAIDQLGE